MNIAFLLRDESLERELKSSRWRGDEQLRFFERPDLFLEEAAKQTWNVLVASDRFFDYASFCSFAERVRTAHPELTLIALLSNRHDGEENRKFLKFCSARSIGHVPPGRPLSSVVSEIHRLIYGGERKEPEAKRIVAFIGSTPNIGTTIVSFGTAAKLALGTGAKIGYLCLNLKSSKIHRYLGVDEPANTLDGIRAELKAQSLTPKRLELYCERIKNVPGLFVLFGNLLREQAEYYTPEDVEHLLEAARSTFHLCIVEVSAYWDNAATICGLLLADTKILVTTDELAHFQEDAARWFKNMAQVLGFSPASFDLFITQKSGGGGISAKDVRRETGLEVIGEMPKYGPIHQYLNEGRLLELIAGDNPVSRSLDGTVNMLRTLYDLQPPQPPKKKSWLARMLAGAGSS